MSAEPQTLFERDPDWMDEWQGMPEYFQENKESVASVLVHFESKEDMQAFCELTGLTVTDKTKGVFYPAKEKTTRKVWVSES